MNPYRLLLLAFPRHVRDEFGHEMELLFEQQLRAVRESGGSPTRVWCSAIGDAVVHGFGERLERADRQAFLAASGWSDSEQGGQRE